MTPIKIKGESPRVKYDGIRKLLVKLVQTNKFVDSFDLVWFRKKFWGPSEYSMVVETSTKTHKFDPKFALSGA